MAAPDELDEREQVVLQRIAANIRFWRRERGMTQKTLASELEMNVISIRTLEAARVKPSVRTLVYLGLVLDVDVAEFFAHRKPFERRTGRPRGS